MTPETRKFVEETQEVCDKATPGDWDKWKLAPDSDPTERLIITSDDGESEICGIVEMEVDANFIALARTALPRALEIIREQAEEIQKLKGTTNA